MRNKLQMLRKQINNFRTLANGYGQWKTIRNREAVDENGSPIPWYTYPAIEYLSHLNLNNFSVFEYGSGNSTLWWASKALNVSSVEDDEKWFNKISNVIEKQFSNVTCYLIKDKEEYIKSANNNNDIFIIDGKYRRECSEYISNLTKSVMILLDNSDRHPEILNFLRQSLGWVQVDFHGFGPINDYTWTTSVLINPERSSEIKYEVNLSPKCGIAAEGE